MSDIIGKRFRRNVYGPSIWEDIVAEVVYRRSYSTSPKVSKKDIQKYLKSLNSSKNRPFKLIPQVLGKNTLKAYDFDEIIFYNDETR